MVLLFPIAVFSQQQTSPPQQKPDPIQEQVTVYATRTEGRLEDLPARVEILDQDEIDEKTAMTPGNIVMMLNETSGLRVQTTSPSLGASSVRIQGMKGRYTRFLADGLPLFGQQGAGLGLLQIRPVDLGQVEIIKGGASALYGVGAMGGVVNLITRRPPTRPLGISSSTRHHSVARIFQPIWTAGYRPRSLRPSWARETGKSSSTVIVTAGRTSQDTVAV